MGVEEDVDGSDMYVEMKLLFTDQTMARMRVI